MTSSKPSFKQNANKEIVYVDGEDDITTIIDKVSSSKHKIIALVLPKNSDTLKSVVNMKLLKRAAGKADKQIVVVSHDETIHKIASGVKVYVADSLKSKPHIPANVTVTKVDEQKSIGDLDQEAINQANSKVGKSALKASTTTSGVKDKAGKKARKAAKKLKVPNFDKFRKRLMLFVLALVALPLLWIGLVNGMARVELKIATNARTIPANFNFIADPNLVESDSENSLLSAKLESNKQQLSERITATGEKEVGGQASGLMTITNCSENVVNIASGTGFSSGNLTFISQSDVSLEDGNFTGGGVCKSSGSHVKTITVVAEQPGDQYNLDARSYDIAGVSGDVSASGGAMSGGSSEIVQVVSQEDIDQAVDKIEAKKQTNQVRDQLSQQLIDQGFTPILATFDIQEASPQFNVAVDQEISEGLASLDITYTMLGVSEADVVNLALPTLQEAAGNLNIIDSGIANVSYSATEAEAGKFNVEASLRATAGLVLDKQQVFEEIKGRPADEAAAELRRREGVTQVEVSATPFWVRNVPTDQSKVEIEINGV